MRANDLTSRLTGLTTPLGGPSWRPPPNERDIARRAVTFLEDRRVLYAADECEVPIHCVRSVLEIRCQLTGLIGDAKGRDPLSEHLRAVRTAGRKFLEQVHDEVEGGAVRPLEGGTPEWHFNQALGELRGVTGVHIALLANRYGLDVEDGLAQILPLSDDGPNWLFDRLDTLDQ